MPLFERINTDQTTTSLDWLKDHYASPLDSPVFIVGAGPSLRDMPIDLVCRTPAPRFCVNMSGAGLLRPNLWTAYDPTEKFHKSTYLDASVMKFVDRARRMNLVPNSNFKVADCPSMAFFSREHREYTKFLDSSSERILDCQDSMIQAIDIAYRLGFRTMYMIGCDMRIKPSPEQMQLGREHGVDVLPNGSYTHGGQVNQVVRSVDGKSSAIYQSTLRVWDDCMKRAGLVVDCVTCNGSNEVDGKQCPDCDGGKRRSWLDVPREKQYSFDEQKSWQAAMSSDDHYYNIAQYLRLARRAITLAGVRIVSCTPGSRLNDIFDYERIERVCAKLRRSLGAPDKEETRGKYSERQTPGWGLAHTSDLPWHGKSRREDEQKKKQAPQDEPIVLAGKDKAIAAVKKYADNMPEIKE